MEHYKTLFVGLDISLKKFNISMIDIESKFYLPLKCDSYNNNPKGLDLFIDHLILALSLNKFNRVKIGFEATGNYGFHLPFYLKQHEKLKTYVVDIYQINPKIIKNARKSFSELPKTDSIDAYVIAERLKIGKLPPYTKFNPQYFALRFLTRSRFDIVTKIVALKSRFISMLFIKASGFVQNKVFSNRFANTFINLFTQFDSVETIAHLEIDKIINFVIDNSKNHIVNPKKIAYQIKYIARESYTINRIMHDSISYSLLTLFNQIKFLKKELKEIDKQISKSIYSFKDHFNILASIKGIGPILSAGIIAELGDLSDFKYQDQVAKFAGLTWKIKQSGNFKSEETRLTKAGNRYLRYYLIEAAQSVVMHNPDFKPYYTKKYNEARKHHHKRALLYVARKLIRVIFSLLKNNKIYQTPDYLKQQKDLANKA
jgi:transposase